MTQIKEFPIFEKRDGQNWFQCGHVYAKTYTEAKLEFADQIWIENSYNKYSDDYVYFDDALIEDMKERGEDMSFYEGEGFYDCNTEPHDVVMLLSEAYEGIESFQHDVCAWTIDKERVK